MVFVAVGAFIGIAPIALGALVAPHRPDPAKLSPYECGFEAFEDARMKFDVRYYLVAILFILFDLEIAFLFPWAVGSSLEHRSVRVSVAMMIFLAILVGGLRLRMEEGRAGLGVSGWEQLAHRMIRTDRVGIEGKLHRGFVTTSVDKLINWTRPARCGR